MSKTIYLEKQDVHCTLCTFIYCSFWQCYSALKQGYTPFINWFQHGGFLESYNDDEMYATEPNAFNWYFKQPFFPIDGFPHRDETWTWEIDGAKMLDFHLMSQPLETIRDFYQSILTFSDSVEEAGRKIVDKYNIDFSKTIGISWRGSDIFLDGRPYIPIERYFKHIDIFLEETPDARIAATAEETGRLEPLFNRYPQAFLIDEFLQVPFGTQHNPERFSPVSGYQRGLQPALMVWLFSKCAYYIKNRSSTGAVASWLSNGRVVCIGHPETLSHENQWDKDQINGIWYDA